MNQKPFIVYSRRLAGFLLMNNCKLIRVEPNINDPLKDVYLFFNSNKLQQLIESFKLQESQKGENESNESNTGTQSTVYYKNQQ